MSRPGTHVAVNFKCDDNLVRPFLGVVREALPEIGADNRKLFRHVIEYEDGKVIYMYIYITESSSAM